MRASNSRRPSIGLYIFVCQIEAKRAEPLDDLWIAVVAACDASGEHRLEPRIVVVDIVAENVELDALVPRADLNPWNDSDAKLFSGGGDFRDGLYRVMIRNREGR